MVPVRGQLPGYDPGASLHSWGFAACTSVGTGEMPGSSVSLAECGNPGAKTSYTTAYGGLRSPAKAPSPHRLTTVSSGGNMWKRRMGQPKSMILMDSAAQIPTFAASISAPGEMPILAAAVEVNICVAKKNRGMFDG